jgi:hypothetical protein
VCPHLPGPLLVELKGLGISFPDMLLHFITRTARRAWTSFTVRHRSEKSMKVDRNGDIAGISRERLGCAA